MLFGVALDPEAEIVRAWCCGRVVFFARGILLPVEEPAAASAEEELLLKLGAAEEAVLATEPTVEDEQKEMEEALLAIPPTPPTPPTGRLGLEVAFECVVEIVGIEPDVDLVALLDLARGWQRLGLLM
jgi:hypothetical protein